LGGILRLPGGVRCGIGRSGAVVNGRAGSWWVLRYGFGFGPPIIAGRGVVMSGIWILILIVITISRRGSRCWLDESGVRLLLRKVRSAMQRILVQSGLL